MKLLMMQSKKVIFKKKLFVYNKATFYYINFSNSQLNTVDT